MLRFISYFLKHRFEAGGDNGEAVVVEFVGCVGRLVVVGVAEGGGVCDHDGWVALLPEGPVVGPVDAFDEFGYWRRPVREIDNFCEINRRPVLTGRDFLRC